MNNFQRAKSKKQKDKSLVMPFFFFVMTCTSCIPGTQERPSTDAYFDIAGYFKAEAIQLNESDPAVRKTVVKNGQPETKTLTGINWETELKPFADTDINLPALKDSYRTDSTHSGDIFRITYTAKSTELPVQKLQVVLHSGACAEVNAILREKTKVFESEQKLQYIKGEGYRISGRQQLRSAQETEYLITAEFTEK